MGRLWRLCFLLIASTGAALAAPELPVWRDAPVRRLQLAPGARLDTTLAPASTLQLQLGWQVEHPVRIQALSAGGDPLLQVFDGAGGWLAADDNSGAALAAEVTLVPENSTAARLQVASAHADGPLQVTLECHLGPPIDAAELEVQACLRAALAAEDARVQLDAWRAYVAARRSVGPADSTAYVAALAPLAEPARRQALVLLALALDAVDGEHDAQALRYAETVRRTAGQELHRGFADYLAGTAHLLRGDASLARRALERAVVALDQAKHQELGARAQAQLGRLLLGVQSGEAARHLAAAAATWAARGDVSNAVAAAIDCGRAHLNVGALDVATEVLAAASGLVGGRAPLAIDAAEYWGEALRRSHRDAEADTVLTRALDQARLAADLPRAAGMLLGLARLARARGALGVALDNAELARQLAERGGSPSRYVEADVVLGEVATPLGEIRAAERFLGEAERLAALYGLDVLEVEAQGRAAKLARARGFPTEAHGPLMNAYRGYKQVGDRRGQATVHIDRAAIACDLIRLTQAETELRRAEEEVRGIDGAPELGRLKAIRARVFREQGRLAEALQLATSALDSLGAGDRVARFELWFERARTLVRLERGDDAFGAYAAGIDALLAARPRGEYGFGEVWWRRDRDAFGEAIAHAVKRGAFATALEWVLAATHNDYGLREVSSARGLARSGADFRHRRPVRPTMDAVQQAVDRAGVTLVVQHSTPASWVGWVLRPGQAVHAVVRPVPRDTLTLWNARVLDSLAAGHRPHTTRVLAANLWRPVEVLVDPERPLVVVPDLATGHLPLELWSVGEKSVASLPVAYLTHAGPLAELAEALAAAPPAALERLTVAAPIELTTGDERRQAISDWAGARGLRAEFGAVATEAQLAALHGADVLFGDFMFPCTVKHGRSMRTSLLLADTDPPGSETAEIPQGQATPLVHADGRLSADEIAAGGEAPAWVTLRTMCVEGTARPSATLIDAYHRAGARVVLVSRWGRLGDPAATDRLMLAAYDAWLAGAPPAAALSAARQQFLDEGGRSEDLASWAVFPAPAE